MGKPRRRILAYAGLACIGLGTAGAVLPVLPTTPFLLLAAWFFARSNPELGERLLAKPIFKPYRRYLDGSQALPARVRYITIAFVWFVVSLSAWAISTPWITVVLVVAALSGSLFILLWHRKSV